MRFWREACQQISPKTDHHSTTIICSSAEDLHSHFALEGSYGRKIGRVISTIQKMLARITDAESTSRSINSSKVCESSSLGLDGRLPL